jgi:superfamily II DNA or RNA helicase
MREDIPGLGLAALIKLNALARPYQRQAFLKHLDEDLQGIVSLPTGAGKTHIGLMGIAFALANQKVPVLVLAPTRALVEQWAKAVNEAIPGVATTNAASWNEYPVLVTTYQYILYNPEILKKAGYVVVDEAHHLRLGENESYRELAIMVRNKPFKLGLTAVPKDLIRELGLTQIYGPVLYSATIKDLAGSFLQGLYVDVRTYPGAKIEDVPPDLVAKTVEELAEAGRKKIRVFANTVTKAKETADALRATLKDYKVFELYGTQQMSPEEQKKTLEEFAKADKAVLVGTTVLNEGINLPESDAAVIATPTRSVISNIQRIGRVIRPGKKGVVPVIYLAPEANRDLLEKLNQIIAKYYGETEEKQMSKEVDEITSALKAMEQKLGAKVSKRYYPVPYGITRYVTDLMLRNPEKYDTLDAEYLQEYLYYYYLNLYGDPSKAYKSWIEDVSRPGKLAGSIREWLLTPGPRPSPSGKLPGKDLKAVDYGDELSLETLGATEEAMMLRSKEFRRLLRRLEATGGIVTPEIEKQLKHLLKELPEKLRERVERVLLLPLSALGEEDKKLVFEAKALLYPREIKKELGKVAGFCTVAAWLANKCHGVPPGIKRSEARRLLREALEHLVAA